MFNAGDGIVTDSEESDADDNSSSKADASAENADDIKVESSGEDFVGDNAGRPGENDEQQEQQHEQRNGNGNDAVASNDTLKSETNAKGIGPLYPSEVGLGPWLKPPGSAYRPNGNLRRAYLVIAPAPNILSSDSEDEPETEREKTIRHNVMRSQLGQLPMLVFHDLLHHRCELGNLGSKLKHMPFADPIQWPGGLTESAVPAMALKKVCSNFFRSNFEYFKGLLQLMAK